MAKKIKCGEFLYKDGVVIKRHKKKFRVPSLPQKLKIPYPDTVGEELVFFPGSPFHVETNYENIDQMNSLKEMKFQKKYKELHSHLRQLYYFGRLVSGVKAVCRRITRRKMSTEAVIDLMAQRTERQRRA